MMIKTAVCTLVMSLALTGCIFRDLSDEYQKAASIEPIKIPSNMTSTPLEPLYAIPQVNVSEQAFYDVESDGFVVPRPEPMSSDREKAKIKIQKVGKARWILAEAATSQVWPLTQNFLSSYGIEVLVRTPATGLVQTDWVEFKSDASTKTQFKIRIEKGLRPETTEVHVLQRQMAIDATEVGFWPASSSDADREAWLLEELANSLAGNIDNKAASLLGQSVGGNVKAELLVGQDEPELRLSLDLSRAWATVAHSLTKEGYSLWDESRDAGVFYVQHVGFAAKKSWLTRMVVKDEVSEETPYSLLDILSHLEETPASKALFGLTQGAVFARGLDKAQGYLVVVRKKDGKVVVKVRNYRGTLLDLKTNKQLLGVLRRNLI